MCKTEELWTRFRRLPFVRICLCLVLDLVELGFPPSLTRVQRYACTAPSIRDLCHLYVDPMRFLLALARCYTRPTGSGGLTSLPKVTELQEGVEILWQTAWVSCPRTQLYFGDTFFFFKCCFAPSSIILFHGSSHKTLFSSFLKILVGSVTGTSQTPRLLASPSL